MLVQFWANERRFKARKILKSSLSFSKKDRLKFERFDTFSVKSARHRRPFFRISQEGDLS